MVIILSFNIYLCISSTALNFNFVKNFAEIWLSYIITQVADIIDDSFNLELDPR